MRITLTNCDRFCLSSDSLRSENALFALFSLVLSREKNRVITTIMMPMDNTFEEEDVLTIFDKMEVQKSRL